MTSDLKRDYDAAGYAVLPGLLNAAEVAAINDAARALSARRELGGVNAGEKMHRRAGVKLHHG